MTDTADAFRALWATGYKSIVPVIPPTADISEGSSLYKRLGTRQDARGKVPGVRGSDGRWFSWDWVPHVADEQDIPRWGAMGAGAGIKTGSSLYALDADTLDERCAAIIRDAVRERIGQTPIRVGRFPKALYLFRVTTEDGEDLPYTRVDFGEPDERGNQERAELLGPRRFFVASGVHPKTREPYSWPKPLVPFDELPVVDAADLDELLNDLIARLPRANHDIVREGAGADIPQERLRADAPKVRAAVAATPNTSANFPTRESYLAMGYAIKAAVEDEHEAFAIFEEWCERWAEGDNDPDVIASDWRRMQPPYRRGATWLFEQAERTSGGAFTSAEGFFDPIAPKAPDVFDLAMQREREEEGQARPRIAFLTYDDIMERKPPVFLVDDILPDVGVGFLYSAPGVGKTFLALDLALAIATGAEDWHGWKIGGEKREVIYLAYEGGFDLRNRLEAWRRKRGLATIPKTFKAVEAQIDFMQPEDVGALLEAAEAGAVDPAIVFVDTVSRAMPGADENLQKEMTIFVRACDRVRDALQCCVVGVHHAGKSGDMRGSTVLRGAGDFVLRMSRREGSTVRELHAEKIKGAEDGWAAAFVAERMALGIDENGKEQSSLTMTRLFGGAGPETGAMDAASARAVLEAMQQAWEEGEPWSPNHQARGRWGVRRMVAEFGFSAQEATDALRMWEAAGLICVEMADGKRHVSGYKPVDLSGAKGVVGAPESRDGGAAGSPDKADTAIISGALG